MTGPATKMYEALRWIACEENTWPESRDDARCAAGTCLEDYPVAPATLEAMDAAAEVMSVAPPAAPLLQEGGIHSDWVEFHARDARSGTGWRNVVCLTPNEADELLRHLLERAIQRRKEAAKHA